MATPPTGTDLLQGHFTLPLFATTMYGAMFGMAPKTREQKRYDQQAGSGNTSWYTHINETDGPGVVSIVSSNSISTQAGDFRVTIDGVVLRDQRVNSGDIIVGLAWGTDFLHTCGPLFFRGTFKLETKRWWSSYSFFWNCVYTKLAWE